MEEMMYSNNLYRPSEHEHTEYIVYHCWDCDEDREVTRTFDDDGNVLTSEERRYFFG
jgi:hypothetical protein